MIVKYCIVSLDADVVLKYFTVDTYVYNSMIEYDVAIRDRVHDICAELNLSPDQVDIYERYEKEDRI